MTFPETHAGFRIHHFAETASTNSLALDSGADEAVFVADTQTAGRGRRAAPWHSAPGLGLWMSVALRRPPADLGPAAALAVREAAAALLGAGTPLALKWPNDLLADGRKVCGILVEHRAGQSALGIGLNLAHARDDFPDDLRDTATSIALSYGQSPARDEWLCAVLKALRPRLDAIAAGHADAVFAEWRDALGLVGRTVSRGEVCGVVERIERDGALALHTADGLARVDAGVVEVRM